MIEIGASAEAAIVVKWSDTAAALDMSGEDAFPEVFATSRMIALMELAAARVLAPALADGQLSVGVGVAIRHTAANLVGDEIRAVATYHGLEGKLYRFHVEAFDARGSVGEGEHTRAIIDTARLLEAASRRAGGTQTRPR
jgi:predicted thioesterase